MRCCCCSSSSSSSCCCCCCCFSYYCIIAGGAGRHQARASAAGRPTDHCERLLLLLLFCCCALVARTAYVRTHARRAPPSNIRYGDFDEARRVVIQCNRLLRKLVRPQDVSFVRHVANNKLIFVCVRFLSSFARVRYLAVDLISFAAPKHSANKTKHFHKLLFQALSARVERYMSWAVVLPTTSRRRWRVL